MLIRQRDSTLSLSLPTAIIHLSLPYLLSPTARLHIINTLQCHSARTVHMETSLPQT